MGKVNHLGSGSAQPAVIRHEGSSVVCGEPDPYKELVESLGYFSRGSFYSESSCLARLAWHLGINGHQDACKAIMKHVVI